MKLLLGLAVTAVTLTGCASSSDNNTTATPDVPATPEEVTSPPVTTVTPAEENVLPSTPTQVTESTTTIQAPPELSGTPSDPFVISTTMTETALSSGNITSASFDSGEGTLAVQIALDGNDTLQEYAAAGTLNGYSRFRIQDDPLDREFLAFASESDDGTLQAVVVSDGGQFNRFFGGGIINQNTYTPGATGLASFAGDYVGISNVGPALVTGNGADVSILPGSTTEVTGSVFINVDFTDNQVNGAIYDRVFSPNGTEIVLQPVILTAAEISANGQFTGTVEFEDLDEVGSYTGALGGGSGESLAGVVSLGEERILIGASINGVATTQFDDVIGETEVGVFVPSVCPAGGASCFDSN